MPAEETRTVTLTADQAAFIDAMVEAGVYASVSAAVQAGIQMLQDPEAVDVDPDDREAYDQWLRDEVIPAYDEVMADPSSTIPAEEVFAEVYAMIAARQKQNDA